MAKPTSMFTLAVTMLAAATATGGARNADDIPAATPTGAAIDCVSTTNIRQTRVRSDSVIDFVMRDRKVYRNTLPYACPSLGFEERFGYEVRGNRLCAIDTIRVLDTSATTPGAACGLGQFQPVTLAEPRR